MKLGIRIALAAFSWLVMVFITLQVVSLDGQQGHVQKIFYYHVPTAWVSFICFTAAFYLSIRYLKTRDLKYDQQAFVYAAVGYLFTTGVLVTGPLWAKPIWGDYWNWADQRLMSFFVLWLSYGGYLFLRISISAPDKRAKLSAILAIISYVNVPLVYLSIRIWNTPSHPGPVVGGEEDSGVTPEMRLVFWFCVISFHMLLAVLVPLLRNIVQQRQALEELQYAAIMKQE